MGCIMDDVMLTIAARNLLYLHYHCQDKSNKICLMCGTVKTPLWRRTKEYHTLCNACGIREKTKNK